MTIRVALTVTHAWHREPSGTAVAINSLARRLQEFDDIDIVGIAPRGGEPHREFAPPVDVVRHALPYPVLYEAWHRFRRPHPERLAGIGTVDVVHAATTLVPPVRDAALVVTVHDLFPLTDPEGLSRRGARLLQRGIELARDEADVVCCPSEQTMRACIDAGFDTERLHLVPWAGRDREATVDDVGRFRERNGLDEPYVAWVGAAVPRKNLAVLFDAIAASPDTPMLVMAGSAGWGVDVDGQIQALGDRARHVGFLADGDIGALLSGANAVVVPSRAEGFGLPALEAMQHGTPVIAARNTAVAEVVGDTGVLFDGDDVAALAAALTDAGDSSWKSERSVAARRRAATYTWDRSAAAMIAAYQAAVGR